MSHISHSRKTMSPKKGSSKVIYIKEHIIVNHPMDNVFVTFITNITAFMTYLNKGQPTIDFINGKLDSYGLSEVYFHTTKIPPVFYAIKVRIGSVYKITKNMGF